MLEFRGLCVLLSGALLLSAPHGVDAQQKVSSDLDPDGLMYGLKFGATENQVVAALGQPSGSLRLTATRKVLVYGKCNLFVFWKGAFRELDVGHVLLDYKLAEQMEDHPLVSCASWTLKPGIRESMTFGKVARLLNRPNAQPDYHFNYETESATVELDFAGTERNPGEADNFTLLGVRIKSIGFQ